jgi:hypothetical protein
MDSPRTYFDKPHSRHFAVGSSAKLSSATSKPRSRPSEDSQHDDAQVRFAEPFKRALEQRLRTATKSGAELGRKRQLLMFDRFLARIVAVLGDAATLKGGLALELRL